jgi:putative peptide zinc metalloprotease protein
MATSTTERLDGLRLADGVEMLGEYQGSGLVEAPYLIRRGDGHTVQVSRLVYLVAEAMMTFHHPEEIAWAVTQAFGREVSADNVLYLVTTKLSPVGIVPSEDPTYATPVTANPLLALRLRVALIPERAHRVVTTALAPLFWPPVIVAVLAAFVAVDIWLFTSMGSQLMDSLQTIILQPQLLLVITLLTLVAGVIHETGHAAAARYGGAHPGAMGAGIYIVWPVFYTDVSDTYRLDRRGRLRTDLGGVYFNLLSVLLAAGMFAVTDFDPLLFLVVALQLETLRQFLPFVRLDGYHVVSDLAGVPNLFAYMEPVLTFVVRRGDPEALRRARHKLGELTTKARTIIIGWVVITAPVLAVNVVLFLVLIPRLAGAAWGSAGGQVDNMVDSSGAISPVGVANGIIGMVLLALPVLGMTYLLGMILQRAAKFAASKWAARPALTGAASGTAIAALVLHVGLAWPSGFVSALSDARGVSGDESGSDSVAVALGNDLPDGLTGTVNTPGAPDPVDLEADPDDDSDGDELADAAPPPEQTTTPPSSPLDEQQAMPPPPSTADAARDGAGTPAAVPDGNQSTTTAMGGGGADPPATTSPPQTSTSANTPDRQPESPPAEEDSGLGTMFGGLLGGLADR